MGTPSTDRPGVRASRLGIVAVLTAVVVWAFTNVVIKITEAPALTFAFWRLWLGVALMIIVLRLSGRRLTWAMVKASAPGGVLFGLNIALFFSAIKVTSVADVLIIQALQPALILMVAGWLFAERITRWDVSWTIVSVAGVVLVTLGSSGTPVWSLRGDLLAVGSLLAWTIYFLVSKSVRRTVDVVEYMTTVTLVGAVVITPIVLASGQGLGGFRWQDWAWLGLFLIAGQGGHLLVAWAHAQVDVSISSLLILAQPIIATVAAFVVLGEPLTVLEIVGGLVVIVAVAAIVRRATRISGTDDIIPVEAPPP
jgi:drug/metabolite transporter (DMT)-like permease